jgi:hypothetical protein
MNPLPSGRRARCTALLWVVSVWLALPARAQPPTFASAQPLAEDQYKYATSTASPSWTAVNGSAWSDFSSGNFTRWVGKGSQQDFSLGLQYTNRVIVLGKKASGHTVLPSATWVGPLFGGEGYTEITASVPLESPYAQHLFIKGGWRYHFNQYLNVDLGGSVNVYDKSVFGQGLPAPWGYKADSPFWVGLTGNVLSSPSVYFNYNPTLGQSVETLSFSHLFDLKAVTGISGLHLGVIATGGLLQADVYNGGNKVLGHNWRNGYAFFDTGAEIQYEVYHGLYLALAGEWGLNNDGSGSTGIAGTNLGPDNNVSFRAGVIYSF